MRFEMPKKEKENKDERKKGEKEREKKEGGRFQRNENKS